jgi:peptidoglycan hydrolase-like protein with peptidoglycan-binding domain
MAEVFTLSGAGLGADWENPGVRLAKAIASSSLAKKLSPQTETAMAQPASSSTAPPIARLQNALKALGTAVGDAKLSKLGVDNLVGPKTVKAVNYAISQKYVVMPSFPNPNLTVQHVRQFASGIAAAVEQAVQAHGGTVPAVSIHRGGGSKASAADIVAAQQAAQTSTYNALTDNPNLVWWVVGGAGLVLALGFMAARKRRGAMRVPAPA